MSTASYPRAGGRVNATRRGSRDGRVWPIHVVLSVGGFVMAFPFLWQIIMSLSTQAEVAEDGVDGISTGGLTKHVQAIDLSMKLGPVPAQYGG